MNEQKKEYSKAITAIVGLIAIVTASFTAIGQVNSWEYRIKSVETTNESLNTSISMLNSEIKSLNQLLNTELKALSSTIQGLNLSVRELQIRQDMK